MEIVINNIAIIIKLLLIVTLSSLHIKNTSCFDAQFQEFRYDTDYIDKRSFKKDWTSFCLIIYYLFV